MRAQRVRGEISACDGEVHSRRSGQLDLLQENDIPNLVEGVHRKLNKKAASELKSDINRKADLANRRRQLLQHQIPHKRLAKLATVREALDNAHKALSAEWTWLDGSIGEELSRRESDAEGLRHELERDPSRRDELIEIWEADELVVELTSQSQVNSEKLYQALKQLSLCVRACETTLRDRQTRLKTKERPQRPDYVRYFFITDLAQIFERTFELPCSAYADGPWCLFLAAVLTRCEGTPVTPENACRLWTSVRKLGLDQRERIIATALERALHASISPPDYRAEVAVDHAVDTFCLLLR